MKRYSALIFDLDGTILLNEKIYEEAYVDILKKHGVGKAKVDGTHIFGQGMDENWNLLKKKFKKIANISLDVLQHETQDAYHSRLKEVKIRHGFLKLYTAARDEQLLVGLATNNDSFIVTDVLEDLGLNTLFDALVTGDEVFNVKPAPDIYLKVAEKLGVDPTDCVVIEDSKAGISSAKEAGMKVVAVRGSYKDGREYKGADLVVDGFEDLKIIDKQIRVS